MKYLFTIDDLMIVFISAIGYGSGEAIPKLFGWPFLLCQVVSFAAGIGLEEIVGRITFSKTVQKKPVNRFLVYTVCFLAFMIVNFISSRLLGLSMVSYLLWGLGFAVILPLLTFVLCIFIRRHRIRKIREQYGDGSRGFVFDVTDKDLEEVNQENQPVRGKYDADRAVKTRTGIYVGEEDKGTMLYLGIPYAKPPLGKLRWKAPEPLPSSDEVFEAKHLGASAIQVELTGSIIRHHRQSEDCLTLNVCVGGHRTDRTDPDPAKPVLVLFHHGDFSYGGSADPLMYGDMFTRAHPDIIFVSFNYRLGILGFIDFSRVPGGEAYPDALNLGLLDQIAALRWIKENIAAFGGDPDRITVIGFQSGGTSISLLAASEQADGLFQKAFVFFGNQELAHDTPEVSRALADDLLRETRTSSMDELMQLKTEALIDAAQKLRRNMIAPTCDGILVPSDINQAYRDKAASGIEFIFGIPGNEMPVYRSFVGNQNYEEFVSDAMADIRSRIDDSDAAAVENYIEAQTAQTTDLEAKSIFIDRWIALCMYRSACALSDAGNKVHLMYWDKKPLIENLGSGTVDALAALLGNSETLRMYGNVMDEDSSEILHTFLHKFVNGEELQLYPNEIRKVDAIDWKPFPAALAVADAIELRDTITPI